MDCFDSLRLSVFFCCCWSTLKWKSRNITKHLMSGPSGNQLVLFSLESWCFPRLRLGKHQDSRENKTNCFPRDLTLNVYYSPPDPPSERRQTRVSYKQNGFPVCCRNKQRNFTNNQTSCPRNTNKVTKFGLEVLTGQDFFVWLEFIDETGKYFFLFTNAS